LLHKITFISVARSGDSEGVSDILICACFFFLFHLKDFLRRPLTDTFATFPHGVYLTSKEKFVFQFPKDAPKKSKKTQNVHSVTAHSCKLAEQ